MKKVLLPMMIILLTVGWQVPVKAQDIPVNYIQNPNMEHELNSIFWYGGWDAVNGSNGTANFPWMYLTDTDAHSGNWSLYFFSQWQYIWVSYPVRGHEQKKMKASFWYKGSLQSYWNFIYRDVGMTEEDLHPSLAQYVGADTAWHHIDGQDALRFDFGGENDSTPDWTYFEFVWDMPGTIPGWGNTSMWYADVPEAWVDDLYYGEWFDGIYSGEEPFGFINGDFELEGLNTEWLVNVSSFDNYFLLNDFLSWTENHSPDPGLQSLRLVDYWEVFPDTNDVVAPYDSVAQDTNFRDKNVLYYLPALKAEGKDMALSFWHKGNEATLDLEFYDDYGVTTNEFALPAGSSLRKDSAFIVETRDTTLVDTVQTTLRPVFEVDSGDVTIDTVDGEWVHTWYQDWEGEKALADPSPFLESNQNFQSYWSDAGHYDGGWPVILNGGGEAYEGWSALWLPGDEGWTGPYGESPPLLVDNTKQRFSFMYKGKLNLWLNIGDYTKYDLETDPDGIVPADATVDGSSLWWSLDTNQWAEWSFEWEQGSWQADSGLADTVSVYFTIGSGYVVGENGFIDNLGFQRWVTVDPPRVDTIYGKTMKDSTFHLVEETVRTDTLNTYWDVWDAAAVFNLPAAADWTEFTLNWTNPSTDIGGTLTMMLDNDADESSPIWITQANQEFDDEHADITFFDDFVYEVTGGTSVESVTLKDLHIYPNPAEDVLYLSLQIPLKKVEMYNVMGQKVKVLHNPDRKFNVSDLSSGMYLIHATDEEGVIHEAKMIKK